MDVPVIVITSAPSPATVETCQTLGVQVFVEKPVRLAGFSKALAELFHTPRPASA